MERYLYRLFLVIESLLSLFLIVLVRWLKMYIRLLIKKKLYTHVVFVTSTKSQNNEVQISASLNAMKS